MGFSTSGAVMVILIGLLVAVSAIVPTLFSVTGATGDAFSAQSDQLRDQQNTDITIESFEYDDGTDVATLAVANDGAISLSVSKTDVVVNGEYYPLRGADSNTTVIASGTEGDEERPTTDIWSPGTTLEIEIPDEDTETDLTGDDSVRITTQNGIAATTGTTDGET
ncbi:flagellin [Natronorubrum sp. JWXQ-INN-674]|uniref:Flagellin n=1 Tax=Natronorubrum halalkaliphilum TaxID=2691917 RepID=A0A6B0VL13_9EURY|nr:flagellin [Natronorubrum halalkaliphilum]MXV61805.1 flagellin [Natronorubrum halalkaliphilum]